MAQQLVKTPPAALAQPQRLQMPTSSRGVMILVGPEGTGKTTLGEKLLSCTPEGLQVATLINNALGSTRDDELRYQRVSASPTLVRAASGWICCSDENECVTAANQFRSGWQSTDSPGAVILEQSGNLRVDGIAQKLHAQLFDPYVVVVIRADQLSCIENEESGFHAMKPNLRFAQSIIVHGIGSHAPSAENVLERVRRLRDGVSFEPQVVFREHASDPFPANVWSAFCTDPRTRSYATQGESLPIGAKERPGIEFLRDFREVELKLMAGMTPEAFDAALRGMPVRLTRVKGALNGHSVDFLVTDSGLTRGSPRSVPPPVTGERSTVWLRCLDPRLDTSSAYIATTLGVPSSLLISNSQATDGDMNLLCDYFTHLQGLAERDPELAQTVVVSGSSMLAGYLETQAKRLQTDGSLSANERFDRVYRALSVAVHPSMALFFDADNLSQLPHLATPINTFWSTKPYGALRRALIELPKAEILGEEELTEGRAQIFAHVLRQGISGEVVPPAARIDDSGKREMAAKLRSLAAGGHYSWKDRISIVLNGLV